METAVRTASRASTALRRSAARHAAISRSRRMFQQQQAHRAFSSPTALASKATGSFLSASLLCSFLVVGGAGFFAFNQDSRPTLAESPDRSEQRSKREVALASGPIKQDYQEVYNAIASKLVEEDDYDDGSYAPVLLRLGWHSSGSYDAATNTGGSNGATMRFPPEGELSANSGLRHARDFLEPVKAQFPWISYSDLWIISAVCAVQEMGGPTIAWRPGRSDKDITFCSPDGRLPDGSKGPDHLRAIFGRMGFDDQEIVALSGGHAVGRCHVDRSGFEGPWTFSPITFTNAFYRLLLEEEWQERPWQGHRQFEDNGSKSLMMLPTDYCLVQDPSFKSWVEKYAADEELFFNDFGKVMVKLFELGVPFSESVEAARMTLERSG